MQLNQTSTCLTALGNTRNEVPRSAQYLNMCVALSTWVLPGRLEVVPTGWRSRKLNVWEKLQEQEKLSLVLKTLMAHVTTAFKYIEGDSKKGDEFYWKEKKGADCQLKMLVWNSRHLKFLAASVGVMEQITSGGSETSWKALKVFKKINKLVKNN